MKAKNARQALPKFPAAAPLLKPSAPDRATAMAAYRDIDQLKGDPSRGQQQFQLLCAPCHRFRGAGQEVGPDLDMVAGKPTEWLVAAILDPAQAIETRYAAWSLKLQTGDELSGIIVAETVNNLVLRMAGSPDRAILRSEIQSVTAQSLSLMPVGFESALEPPALADLLAWLRKN